MQACKSEQSKSLEEVQLFENPYSALLTSNENRPSGAIIIGGEKVIVPGVTVITWEDHDMKFDTSNSAVRRMSLPNWFVVHWSASERMGTLGAQRFFNSMLTRMPIPLSVEFLIDNLGTIFQFADPAQVRCRHASRINDMSVGVEVSCRGWKKRGKTYRGITLEREQYRAELPDWRPTFFDFFEEQDRALLGLARALTSALPIPPVVLGRPWSRRPKGFFENESGGICGHVHCAHLKARHPKQDPGPAPLIRLARDLQLAA